MTSPKKMTLALAAFLTMGLGLAALSSAQESRGVKALRDQPLTETGAAPDLYKQSSPAEGFGRAYRQNPRRPKVSVAPIANSLRSFHTRSKAIR